MTTTVKPEKLDSLQALRAFAFLGVFSLHSYISEMGAWGVSVFIILSGFLLVYNYYDKDLPSSLKGNIKFAFRKINKLYPLHVVMLLASVPFVLYNDFSRAGFGIKAILNLSLLQAYCPQGEIYFSFNGVSWYLSVCTLLYFAFPLILKWIKNYRSKKSAFIGIGIAFSAQLALAFIGYFFLSRTELTGHWFDYISPVYRLGDFIIGCNLGYLFLKRPVTVKSDKFKFSILELVSVFVAVISIMIYTGKKGLLGSEWFRYTVLFVPGSVALVYFFALKKGVISKLSANKFLVFIGDISPFAYLIHQQLIRYVQSFLSPIFPVLDNRWVLSAVCLVLTVIASVVWKNIDKRVRQRLRVGFGKNQ